MLHVLGLYGKSEHQHRETMQTPHRKASWDLNQGSSCFEADSVCVEVSFFNIMFLLRVLKFRPFSECHHWEYKLLETEFSILGHMLSLGSDCIMAVLCARLQMKPLLPSSGLMAILEVLKENQFQLNVLRCLSHSIILELRRARVQLHFRVWITWNLTTRFLLHFHLRPFRSTTLISPAKY